MYFKKFDEWNNVKKKLDSSDKKVFIRKGEIRWATVGVNVGSEMDGKGDSFTRPVLIIEVIGSKLALVVPLSSQIKNVPGRFVLNWKETQNSICVNQIKIISTKRILSRKGKISDNKLQEVKQKIKEFYNF